MSKGIGGKIENFAITTDGQRQLELPSMLAGEADNNLNGIKYCYNIKCLSGILHTPWHSIIIINHDRMVNSGTMIKF